MTDASSRRGFDGFRRAAARVAGGAIRIFARLLTAVRAEWRGSQPVHHPRIYFANHNSHGDFILIWTVLPTALAKRCRPVAGLDYWAQGRLRSFIGSDVFNTVLIDRTRDARSDDPVGVMAKALDQGHSLILFPEGTRNLTDEPLLPFKSGLYHLAHSRPEVELIPVWIDNLNRVLPKGEIIPVPIMCKVVFGAPLQLTPGEDKAEFLCRARGVLLALRETPEAHAGEKGTS